jgi:2-C-methyl-D-erythritol 4-phosphate cytidylyltransferase
MYALYSSSSSSLAARGSSRGVGAPALARRSLALPIAALAARPTSINGGLTRARPSLTTSNSSGAIIRAAICAARPHQQQCRSPIVAASAADAASPSTSGVPPGSVAVILLSGGSGKRMGAPIPKQYLELRGRAIATHSMATFARMPEVGQVVVVCDPAWRHVFEPVVAAELTPLGKKHSWALPGAERQDSVASGLAQVDPSAGLVAVHDSARPLVSAGDAARCMRDAWQAGAAVLGVPCKQTVKEVDAATGLVARTLDRSLLWEVQTPQCIRPELLRRGFEHVAREQLAVTDDVSVVEALGEPVRITRGCYTNIKVTTPEDMGVAEGFIDEREAKEREAKQQRAPAAAAAAA